MQKMTRRQWLRRSGVLAGGLAAAAPLLSACAPKILKETVVVEKEVERVVKETVVVKEAVEVEKEVTRVVEKEVVAEPAGRKPYNVLYDGADPESEYGKAITQLFHEWYPEYTLEFRPIASASKQERYQKLLTMIASKTVGDLYECSPAHFQYHRFAHRDLLLDVMPLVQAEAYDLGVFVPVTMTEMTLEGKLYGFPNWTYAGYDAVLWNKEMFSELGLANWEEGTITPEGMVEVGAKIARDVDGDGRQDVWGWFLFPQLDHVLNNIRMFDGDVISPDGTKCILNEEGGVKSMRWFAELLSKDIAPKGSMAEGSHAMFVSQKLGQTYVGAHNIMNLVRDIVADMAFEWGYVNLPRTPNGKHPSNLRVGAWTISSLTKDRDASWACLKTFASHEGGVLYGTLPGGSGMAMGRMDVLMDPVFTTTRPGWLTALAAMPECMPQHYPANYRGDEAWDVFQNNFARFLEGEWAPEEAAQEIAVAVQEVLDRPAL